MEPNRFRLLTKRGGGRAPVWMASRPIGTRFPFDEAATEKLIRVSDQFRHQLVNQAVGGKARLNARFQALRPGPPRCVNKTGARPARETKHHQPPDPGPRSKFALVIPAGKKPSVPAENHFRRSMGTSRNNTLRTSRLAGGLGKDRANPGQASCWREVSTVLNKTG